jgi:hypothetical protein
VERYARPGHADLGGHADRASRVARIDQIDHAFGALPHGDPCVVHVDPLRDPPMASSVDEVMTSSR